MTRELDQAYEHCRRLTRERAKNFYYAFITLPPRKRKAIYATYAFCRLCDDATDEAIPVEEKHRLVKEQREKLSRACAGEPVGPVFVALADAMKTYHIPAEYFEEVVKGVETDITRKRYANFDELREYCYRVASAVGLICIEVFGYKDPAAKEYAIDLGLAMQLTNILRDIEEDLGRDRIYIPQEEMASFGYSEEELFQGEVNDSFRDLMRFQVGRTREYFQSGKRLMPLLSLRARACPAVLHGIYSRLLDRMEATDYNVFNGRISLSTREKLTLTAKLWMTGIASGAAGR